MTAEGQALRSVRRGVAEISMRARPVGGDRKNPEPLGVVANRDDLLLLIHGFAVNEKDARERYDEFRANLDARWNDRTANLYWPGDVGTRAALATGKGGLGSRILSATAYSLQIKPAEDSARRLMRYITSELVARRLVAAALPRSPKRFQLRIVAHSLGCLVTLEFLKALEPFFISGELEVPLAVLMAAAVPQYRMRDEDFGIVIKQLGQVIIYHSYRDLVLAVAFPPGQAAQWHVPYGLVRRAAVGRHGCGCKFDNVTERLGKRGHGAYWRDVSIGREVLDELTGRNTPLPGVRTVIARRTSPRGMLRRVFRPWNWRDGS
jgi:hypothetical protein